MVYIGTLHRYISMAKILVDDDYLSLLISKHQVLSIGAMNDLAAGDLDGLTEQQRDEMFPFEKTLREDDKLNYRYPGVGGESYFDLVTRCNDIICHLEKSRGDSIVISDR